jgi:hypothetical protein
MQSNEITDSMECNINEKPNEGPESLKLQEHLPQHSVGM